WDMDTNYLEYDFSMLGLSLKSFNLYRLLPLSLESLFDLDIYGSGILSADHSMRSSIITRESMIRKNKVPNSRLDAYFANNELTVQADLMESMARLEAFIPFKGKKDTLVRANLSATDIRPLVGLLSPSRMMEESLQGRVFSQLQASFPLFSPEKADVRVDIRALEVNYKQKKVHLTKATPLIVTKGSFKDWSLTNESDSDFKLTTSASGNLAGDFSLYSDYQVPAEF